MTEEKLKEVKGEHPYGDLGHLRIPPDFDGD